MWYLIIYSVSERELKILTCLNIPKWFSLLLLKMLLYIYMHIANWRKKNCKRKKALKLSTISPLYMQKTLSLSLALIFNLQINTDLKMESKRQNSLWSWGYKNINSRLFCLCFRGLSWWDSMCVQMSGEYCLMPIKTKTGDTSVSSDHCLVKVCPRGKGGHMCLRKWKRGWCAQTGLVPCRNPPNQPCQSNLLDILILHPAHPPSLCFVPPSTPSLSAFSVTNYTFIESWASSPRALHFNVLPWDGHTALTATMYT